MKDDIIALFSDTEAVKEYKPSYDGEYLDITVKEKYEKYPKIKYPMITIEEMTNEDVQQYFEGTERISYLAYQIEINSGQDEIRTAVENVSNIADIIDSYMKDDRYRCLRRIGGLSKAPLISDNNIMVGYLRYECNLDIKTNTIYRR